MTQSFLVEIDTSPGEDVALLADEIQTVLESHGFEIANIAAQPSPVQMMDLAGGPLPIHPAPLPP